MYLLNPGFHRFPTEAHIIGRMVVSFGEIEYLFISLAEKCMNANKSMFRALYRLRSTSSRLEAADALIYEKLSSEEFLGDYVECYSAIKHCLRVRNGYAHCNWGDSPQGLFYTSLQEETSNEPEDFHWYHVDVAIVQAQENYFVYCQSIIYYLIEQVDLLYHEDKDGIFPLPSKQEKCSLHNPPERYVPEWLSEDQKALHLARALAAGTGVPTPTRKQQALNRATAEKRALKAQRDERSRPKNSSSD